MKTLATFIKETGITATVQRIMSRDDIEPKEWDKDARHWKVTLIRGNRKMEVPFSQGSAHTKPPTVEDVLDCLASDASGVESARSFEDWCGEYGYNTDSRKAESIYKVCVKQASALKMLLASPGRSSFGKYDELLYKIERL